MTRCLMVLSAVGLFLGGVASATVQQGDTELELLGGYLTENSGGATLAHPGAEMESWFISGAIGYFLTDNFQVEAAGMGMWTTLTVDNFGSADQDVDLDVYGVGVRAKWHFMPTNQWVPYVGGQIMWTNIDIDASDFTGSTLWDNDYDGTLWGPVVGLRFELNETNDFIAEYQYHIWEDDVGRIFDDGHGLFVGIIHQFK